VTPRHKVCLVLATALLLLLGAGCGGDDETPTEVVLVTHDSFAISEPVKQAFEDESGLTLRILKAGDAGEVVTRALLTAGEPEGDVLFGVDNNLLARTLEGDVFTAYESAGLESVDLAWQLDNVEHRVTPIDHGEVCLNYDKAWYRERGIAPPESLDDLVEPDYRGQLVVEHPATSTPGLAFLLATVAQYGDPGWQDYWRRLRANDVLVVDGWEEAYNVRFSGSAGKGPRPIVVSYASSPPAEVIFRDPRPAEAPTGVVFASCYRQIEFAGILRGARNEDGARKLVDFMLQKRFQEDIPLQMFVFPVSDDAAVPPEFEPYAGGTALGLASEHVEENRERWVDEWTDIVVR
jgi:thiamine transport system substrate-binding protein